MTATIQKKEVLVRTLTSSAKVNYGKQIIGFYDNPKVFTPRGTDKEITRDRLYIVIENAGSKDTCIRTALTVEIKRYKRAYDLYLEAKKCGGKLDEVNELVDSLVTKNKEIEAKDKLVSEKDAEIDELRKQLVAKQEEAKKKA